MIPRPLVTAVALALFVVAGIAWIAVDVRSPGHGTNWPVVPMLLAWFAIVRNEGMFR